MEANLLSSRSIILIAADILIMLGVLTSLSHLMTTRANIFFLILALIILFALVIRDLYSITHKTAKIAVTVFQALIIGYIPSFIFLYFYEVCRQNCIKDVDGIDKVILYYGIIPFAIIIPAMLFMWSRSAKDMAEGLYIALVIGVPVIFILYQIFSTLFNNYDLSVFIISDYTSFIALLISFPLIYILIIAIRKLYYYIKSTNLLTNFILLGNNDKSKKLLEHIHLLPANEFKFAGILYTEGESSSDENIIGSIDQLNSIINDHKIKLIVDCTNTEYTKSELKDIFYNTNNVEKINFIEFYEAITRSIPVAYVDSKWIFNSLRLKNRNYYFVHKRIMDIITASIILLVTSPVLFALYIYGQFSSPGPFLYKQKRLARNNKLFDCYKLRTMVVDADKQPLGFEGCKDDPRITPLGRLVRPMRLDEIPQMINILCGDLAIVGPRPDVPQFEKSLAEIIPFHHIRRASRQGWTGWAQISGGHSDTLEANKQKFEYDLYYLKHSSLLFDLTIFFRALILTTSGKHG